MLYHTYPIHIGISGRKLKSVYVKAASLIGVKRNKLVNTTIYTEEEVDEAIKTINAEMMLKYPDIAKLKLYYIKFILYFNLFIDWFNFIFDKILHNKFKYNIVRYS